MAALELGKAFEAHLCWSKDVQAKRGGILVSLRYFRCSCAVTAKRNKPFLSWLLAGFVEAVGRDAGRLVHLLWIDQMKFLFLDVGFGVCRSAGFGVDGNRNFLWFWKLM
jgi:hypothetical protein